MSWSGNNRAEVVPLWWDGRARAPGPRARRQLTPVPELLPATLDSYLRKRLSGHFIDELLARSALVPGTMSLP